jgi:uncharacterized protein (TIGR02147 family)
MGIEKNTDAFEITQFDDYRDYLKSLFAKNRELNSKFSFQYCARRMGTSRGYLQQIIEKRRHLGLDNVPAVSRLFKLDSFEKEYLTFLVLYGQTKDLEIRVRFASILKGLRSARFAWELSPCLRYSMAFPRLMARLRLN